MPARSNSPKPSLLEQIRQRSIELDRRGPRCTIAIILDDLDPDAADELRQVLATPTVLARAIADVLTAAGYRLSQSTVNRHRSGGCACERR